MSSTQIDVRFARVHCTPRPVWNQRDSDGQWLDHLVKDKTLGSSLSSISRKQLSNYFLFERRKREKLALANRRSLLRKGSDVFRAIS